MLQEEIAPYNPSQLKQKVEFIQEVIMYMRDNAKRVPILRQNKVQLGKVKEIPLLSFFLEQNHERDLYRCLELRRNHRQLFLGLEENRKKNQLEKELLDKETIHSECLEYQKNQLISHISSFKSFKTQNFEKLKSSYQNRALERDHLSDKDSILKELENELKIRKDKKLKLEQKLQEKQQLEEIYEIKNRQFFIELPQGLKKIQNDLSPILQLFQLPNIQLPQQQLFVQELPEPLLQLYQKLAAKEELNRDKHHDYPIRVEILNNTSVQEQSIYQLNNHELKLHILEPREFSIYDKSSIDQTMKYLKTNIKEFFNDIYPIIIYIRYFPLLNKVVFQVDRRNKLLTEELLCGLVKNQPGEPLFSCPNNEDERNINTRYMYFEWVQAFAGILNFRTEILTAENFVQLIHKRVYNVQQLKIQVEQLKNCEVPGPLTGISSLKYGMKIKYFGPLQASVIQGKEKPPFWHTYFQGETMYQLKMKEEPLEICLNTFIKQQDSLLLPDLELEVKNNPYINLYLQFFNLNYCLENQQEHLNEFYKMILEKDNIQIELAIIIPLRYPYQNVRFLLLQTEGIQITNMQWFRILRNLNLFKEYPGKLVQGCEGLQLSYLVHRLIEEIFDIFEKKSELQLYLKQT